MESGDFNVKNKYQDEQASKTVKNKKILAVCSGGGHWEQMKLLKPAFKNYPVVYITEQCYKDETKPGIFYAVKSASRWNKIKIVILSIQILLIILKERPVLVISTGAAPGFFAVLFGKIFLNARTIWLDSLANCQSISLSGWLAKPFVNLMLTQHENLAKSNKLHYKGRLV